MNVGEQFINDILDVMPSQQAKMACVAFLSRWAGKNIYLPQSNKAERRQRAAFNMIASKEMSNREIASALRERFGVTARTAYRDVKSARKNVSQACLI
jgi:Mor family transcriptional regulator